MGGEGESGGIFQTVEEKGQIGRCVSVCLSTWEGVLEEK